MGKTNLAVGYKSQFYTQEFQVVDADVVSKLGLYWTEFDCKNDHRV